MQWNRIDDCEGRSAKSRIIFDILNFYQGLVANGAKVYVTALPTDDIAGAVAELQELGKDTGGQAIG